MLTIPPKILVNQNGHKPNENGHKPNENGHKPNQKGHKPNQKGHKPNQNCHNTNNMFVGQILYPKQNGHNTNNKVQAKKISNDDLLIITGTKCNLNTNTNISRTSLCLPSTRRQSLLELQNLRKHHAQTQINNIFEEIYKNDEDTIKNLTNNSNEEKKFFKEYVLYQIKEIEKIDIYDYIEYNINKLKQLFNKYIQNAISILKYINEPKEFKNPLEDILNEIFKIQDVDLKKISKEDFFKSIIEKQIYFLESLINNRKHLDLAKKFKNFFPKKYIKPYEPIIEINNAIAMFLRYFYAVDCSQTCIFAHKYVIYEKMLKEYEESCDIMDLKKYTKNIVEKYVDIAAGEKIALLLSKVLSANDDPKKNIININWGYHNEVQGDFLEALQKAEIGYLINNFIFLNDAQYNGIELEKLINYIFDKSYNNLIKEAIDFYNSEKYKYKKESNFNIYINIYNSSNNIIKEYRYFCEKENKELIHCLEFHHFLFSPFRLSKILNKYFPKNGILGLLKKSNQKEKIKELKIYIQSFILDKAIGSMLHAKLLCEEDFNQILLLPQEKEIENLLVEKYFLFLCINNSDKEDTNYIIEADPYTDLKNYSKDNALFDLNHLRKKLLINDEVNKDEINKNNLTNCRFLTISLLSDLIDEEHNKNQFNNLPEFFSLYNLYKIFIIIDLMTKLFVNDKKFNRENFIDDIFLSVSNNKNSNKTDICKKLHLLRNTLTPLLMNNLEKNPLYTYILYAISAFCTMFSTYTEDYKIENYENDDQIYDKCAENLSFNINEIITKTYLNKTKITMLEYLTLWLENINID